MSRKVQLRLMASDKMSEKRENDLIRFPRRARAYFSFSNDVVTLGKGEYQISLRVKKAYREDIARLIRNLEQGKITDEEAKGTGFVTRTVQQRFSRRQGGSVWVSGGTGKITVGADPEFGLIGSDDILIRGNNILPRTGLFGSDGPGVEVRPAPARDHLRVVSHIGEILKASKSVAEPYRWVGGATYTDRNRTYWFGGHIHLGRPVYIGRDYAGQVYTKIATVLDSLLALPVVRFDAPNPSKRRNGCDFGYGKAGDIRTDYPEQDRFEYRVLSGLWVVHPTLAKIALGAAKCIAETAYNRLGEKKFDIDWATANVSQPGLLKSFGLKGIREITALINRAKPQEVTPDHIKVWKRQIRNMDFFDEYAPELKALMALTVAGPSEFELDLKKNWRENNPLLPKAGAHLKRALEAVEEKQ